MCGYAGYINLSKNSSDDFNKIIKSMNDTIYHRGPDAEGFFKDTENQIFIGHRRLSIIDLSPSGIQPFHSQSGRYIIAFNGEIYNYLDLKNQIKGVEWKSTTDTEVLIESIEQFGIDKTLEKVDGMYSFALWDKKLKKLILCRDRAGEKPLYYGKINNNFLFGSELKAISKHPRFSKQINTEILDKYFQHGYIPTPFSIYKNIFKLSPGCYLEVDLDDLKSGTNEFKEKQYWSFKEIAQKAIKNHKELEELEYINTLDALLNKSVRRQMVSDVPLGAFLSGGIDSSLISAIMQNNSSNPIKTFTIGFTEDDFDEAPFAKKIANHIGSDHTEHYCSIKDTVDIIPNLTKMYDEPFADSSQIPTYLLSKITKQHVTVSLSGDAGDELFYGYSRYNITTKINGYLRLMPKNVRILALKIFNKTPKSIQLNVAKILLNLFSSYLSKQHDEKSVLKRINDLMSISSDENLYRQVVSIWDKNSLVLNDNNIDKTFVDSNFLPSNEFGLKNFMTSFDVTSYLNDDILVKVDRASMAVSLESRIPLLSKSVMEFSMVIPNKYKYKNGTNKWILQQVLQKYVPSNLFNRPKMGFGIPINSWIRNELNDWTLDLLNEKKIKEQGILNFDVLQNKYNEHMAGIKSNEYYLWPVLIFQQWMEDLE